MTADNPSFSVDQMIANSEALHEASLKIGMHNAPASSADICMLASVLWKCTAEICYRLERK